MMVFHYGNITCADAANITIRNSAISNSKYDGIQCTIHYGPAASPSVFTINVIPDPMKVGTVTITVVANKPLIGTPTVVVKDSAGGTIVVTLASVVNSTYTYSAVITEGTPDGTATISVVGTDTATNQGTGSKTFQVSIPRKVVIVDGDGQTGIVFTTLLKPFVVKVTDNLDRPIPGHIIHWQIIEEQATANLSTITTTTGINGTTSSTLTLGTKSGTYRVTASGSMQATFTATATPGTLMTINLSPQSLSIVMNQQQQFTAAGYDQFNNWVGNLSYNWGVEGNIGSVTPTIGTSTILTAASYPVVGTITAGTQGVTGKTAVIITYGQVTTVTITPQSAEVVVQGTKSFTAAAFNQFGDIIPASVLNYAWQLITTIGGSIAPTTGSVTTFTAGNNTGQINIRVTVDGKQAQATVTVIPKPIEKIGFMPVGTLTAWMPGTITLQLQDRLGNPRPATVATTIIVTGDGNSRFATASVGVHYNVVGTFTVEAGTACAGFFFKQNGTITSVIITATILGTNTSGTISVTFVQPVTGSSSGTVVGDDGETMVIIAVGAIAGQGVIEIDTNPGTTTQTDLANQADNADTTINRVEGTMREFEIHNATITTTVLIVIPYPDADNDGYVDGMIPQTQEMTLAIFKLVGSRWVEVPGSVVDPVNNTVSVPVSSFSYYIVMGKVKGAEDTLNNVFIWPNPCRIYKGDRQITFGKLTGQANIKLFNIAGELVKEIEHTNGTDGEVWTNPGEVASGVYIYLITNDKGQKVIGKLGIIK
ncbi:MAG: T9SS type A sorting domain-containing protein [Nitrospirota bacterium]